MSDTTKLGPWVRRLLLEHLVSERNLARNTQRSYRDTLALLIPFIAGKVHKPIDQLDLDHLTADRVRQFLQSLEQTRSCSVASMICGARTSCTIWPPPSGGWRSVA